MSRDLHVAQEREKNPSQGAANIKNEPERETISSSREGGPSFRSPRDRKEPLANRSSSEIVLEKGIGEGGRAPPGPMSLLNHSEGRPSTGRRWEMKKGNLIQKK